tara:strand:- start:18812 stop:19387 length:576 start_codon:yes stop_codon:yes gene_type:complete
MPENRRSKKSRDEQWNARLQEVRAFAHSHNRWPSTTSDDESEKKLAQWWSRQKYYYNRYEETGSAPGMNSERSSAMSSLIEAFARFERDGIWMYRYNKVKRQIDNHGRLWHYNTTNPEEEKTLRWWNQQKTFCRKYLNGEPSGGMTKRRAKLVQSLQEKIGQPLIREDDNTNFKEVLGFEAPTGSKDDTDV